VCIIIEEILTNPSGGKIWILNQIPKEVLCFLRFPQEVLVANQTDETV
jgi:hypothetical protein